MPKVILDLRGLAIHCYHRGKDPDAWMEGSDELKTAGHTLGNFLEEYLLPICKEHSIFDIVAVHEGGNQYRKSIFPGYKEKRAVQYSQAKSGNINESAKAVSQLLAKLGILSVRYDGVEGDDVIAYLCQKLPGDKIVHTVDKDMIQLASDSVRVFLKNREEVDIVDAAGNVVQPRHIALYKSIVGDSSDEYPGVPGVGPAGYLDLFKVLNEGAVVRMLETGGFDLFKQVGHPVAKKLAEHLDLWKTCYQLAKLHPEECERTFRVSGTGVEAVYRYRRPEWNKELPQEAVLRGFLEGHECGYLMEDLTKENLVPVQVLVQNKKDTYDSFYPESVALSLKNEPYVSIDFETASVPNENFIKAARGKDFVDVFGSEVVSMGLTIGRHAQHTYYFTFDHKETEECKNLPLEVLDRLIKAVPEKNTFIIQNLGFERCVLLNTRGVEINEIHDTLLVASYVDENKPLPEYLKAVYEHVDDDEEEEETEEDILGIVDPTELAPSGSHKSKARSGWDLKFMARRYLGYKQTEYSEVVPKGQTMRDITAQEAFHYGADDPLVTIHLYWYLRTILELEGTWERVRDWEFPAACLISDAFVDGVSVDEAEMQRQADEDRKLLDELLAKMRGSIKENQTEEMIDAGVSNLYAELSEEVKAKARFEKVPVEEFQKRTCDLMVKLRKTVPYADYERVEKEHKFDVTPSKLEAICAAFGLPHGEPEFGESDTPPRLSDLKTETIANYVAYSLVYMAVANQKKNSAWRQKSPAEACRFLGLLKDCSEAGEFTPKRRGKAYQALRDHCYEAWRNNLPDDKRYEYTGFEFNLGSTAQKKLLMYGMLNLPRVVFNPKVSKTRAKWGMSTGPVQTNKEAISDAMANSLARDDWRWKVLEDLITAQRCQTRLSLFYSVWPLYVHPLDGNVHPGIRSVGTETHRPSGNSPNALQLPKRGDGKKVRKCIVPNRKFYLRKEVA